MKEDMYVYVLYYTYQTEHNPGVDQPVVWYI